MWADMKQALTERFSNLSDVQYALQQLKRLKQGVSESMAELAFVNQDINNPIIQHQLNDVLIDGLKEDVIVRKII